MNNELLRHMLASMAYRVQKTLKYASEDFGEFNISEGTRKPKEILNHINDVLNKTTIFIETEKFDSSDPPELGFDDEVKQFQNILRKLDMVLLNNHLDINFCKKLIQGPFSDVFSHIGQLSMLCGLSGSKIPGEDFSAANIITGEFKLA